MIFERVSAVYPGIQLSVVGMGTNAYTVLRTGTKHILYEHDGATRQLGIQPLAVINRRPGTRAINIMAGLTLAIPAEPLWPSSAWPV